MQLIVKQLRADRDLHRSTTQFLVLTASCTRANWSGARDDVLKTVELHHMRFCN